MCELSRALLILLLAASLHGSGNGPVFAYSTFVNPERTWSLDYTFLAREGEGPNELLGRATLAYGVLRDFQVSVSAPALFRQDGFGAARVSGPTPINRDVEAIGWWRLQRKSISVGQQYETTAFFGVSAPGPQASSIGTGLLAGLATGVATRSYSVWGGASYQWRTAARPDQFVGTFAYGVRPKSWRTDYPRWDLRYFVEALGEKVGNGRNAIFVGPSIVGAYKSMTLHGGVQLPIYRDTPPTLQKERLRLALGVGYFF